MSKIDSNIVALRIAEEVIGQVGVLPGSPVWMPFAPNSYGEFGATIKTIARNPISAGRQRLKGNVVDLDAVGGFQLDFTTDGIYPLLQGFMFANWREKPKQIVTSVTGTAIVVASTANINTGDLVFVENAGVKTNNGLKIVTGKTATDIQVSGLVAEATPPASMKVTKVGMQAGAGDITVTIVGGVPQLNSTTFDFTTLGVIPGEWIFIGGDATITQFNSVTNNGFVRVGSVTTNALVIDRQPTQQVLNGPVGMIADAGTGKTIRLFVGHVIKNEADPVNIVTRSYHLERAMGSAGYEYVWGAVPNTLEIQVNSANKITVEMGFIATDAGDELVAKAGSRPALKSEGAFNATSDFSRLRTQLENTNATLFTYLTETRLTINNGVEPTKSVAKLGGFDVTLGDFAVAGSTKAYFTSSDAVTAVRNNEDVSTDFALVSKNVGWLFDMPLLSLGNGRRNVEKDKAVILDLTSEAAAHPTLNHTLLVGHYPYLPNLAQ